MGEGFDGREATAEEGRGFSVLPRPRLRSVSIGVNRRV